MLLITEFFSVLRIHAACASVKSFRTNEERAGSRSGVIASLFHLFMIVIEYLQLRASIPSRVPSAKYSYEAAKMMELIEICTP
jgi:hypothetical protein